VPVTANIQIAERMPYVGRGGLKLEAALQAFAVVVEGSVCADIGASTGGFTDCLLQHRACRVYAVDVGYGQLDWKLRQDTRVVVMERVNARFLTQLPELVNVVTADVSFISLKLILPHAQGWLHPDGQVIALIKPQFEAGRRQVHKGGVVRDPAVHRAVLIDLLSWTPTVGLHAIGLIPSPLRGPAGNVEFLAHLTLHSPQAPAEVEPMVEKCLAAIPPRQSEGQAPPNE